MKLSTLIAILAALLLMSITMVVVHKDDRTVGVATTIVLAAALAFFVLLKRYIPSALNQPLHPRSPMTELQLMQGMTDSQRILFQTQMAQYRRSFGMAALLAFFGFFGMHRFYLGQIGLGCLMAITLGGFFIWALIDLLRIRSLVEAVNNRKASEIAMQVKALATAKA